MVTRDKGYQGLAIIWLKEKRQSSREDIIFKEGDMYQNILAPLDGSDFAECALAHVSAIATGCRVPNVTLLRVVEPLPQQAYAEVSVLMADADKDGGGVSGLP